MKWETEALVFCPMCELGLSPMEDRHIFRALTKNKYMSEGYFYIEYDECPHCGLILRHKMPTEESLKNYYSTIMYRHGFAEPTDKEIQVENLRARRMLEFLLNTQDWEGTTYRYRGIPPITIDIGSSTGAFGGLFQMYGAEIAWGVEPGPWAEYSKKHLQKVLDNINGIPAELQRKFDLVTMSHVLEHIHDPIAMLLKCRRLLNDTGRLLISVPDIHRPYNSIWAFPHLFVFTYRTLKSLLWLAGFEITDRLYYGPDITVIAKRSEPKYTIHRNFPFLIEKHKLFRRLYDRYKAFTYWGNRRYWPESQGYPPTLFAKLSHVLRKWYILFGALYSVPLFMLRRLLSRK